MRGVLLCFARVLRMYGVCCVVVVTQIFGDFSRLGRRINYEIALIYVQPIKEAVARRLTSHTRSSTSQMMLLVNNNDNKPMPILTFI